MLHITDEGRRLIREALGSSLYATKPKITLAGPKPIVHKPKLPHQRQESLIEKMIAILRSSRFSKFEFEGPCRNGLRKALVGEGWWFHEAELAANEIVGKALSRIGAVRPSPWEAQFDYTYEGLIVREHCKECNRRIPDERIFGANTKYCCNECGDRFRERMQRLSHEQMTRAEWSAHRAAQSAKTLSERSFNCEGCGKLKLTRDRGRRFCSIECTVVHPPKPCGHCGEMFKPKLATTTFCSNKCRAASDVIIPVRPCDHCGSEFKPRKTTHRFCSLECTGLGTRKPRPEQSCLHCSTIFTLKRPSAPRLFCSPLCSIRHRYGKPVCQETTI